MPLTDFNLLITTSRGNEDEACSEAWFLLGELGDRESLVEKTGVLGLVAVKTKLNPFEVIEGFRRILSERPYEFRYISRVIPIETVVRTRLDEIRKAVEKLSKKILEGETFRVTVEKRHTQLSSREIIEAAAASVDRKVDLQNPDKVILIEVLGGLTGISVIKPDDILSVVKERR
ncbi:RNA methyltransferase [Candidatus Bathyarchaeota archaeon]|nr:MAG: RNA methyltransferase [Candidatus Bathyarchaeota archaeon]RLG97102.1 MAG: RNA methyltransferase [Candidatus Bathyarchaeota archaeon]HDJ04405.1 RNA methyltransferase [Candidatus Bathyarchaeota archaeon]